MIIGINVEVVFAFSGGTMQPKISDGGAKDSVKKHLHNLGQYLANQD